ncbi:MAG: hypothetical protein EZS28_029219, partial [Streblomastix strix]
TRRNNIRIKFRKRFLNVIPGARSN